MAELQHVCIPGFGQNLVGRTIAEIAGESDHEQGAEVAQQVGAHGTPTGVCIHIVTRSGKRMLVQHSNEVARKAAEDAAAAYAAQSSAPAAAGPGPAAAAPAGEGAAAPGGGLAPVMPGVSGDLYGS